jgi:hypothetical protein
MEIGQVITRIQKDANNVLDWGKNAVQIALMWAIEEYQNDAMSQLDWEEMFGFYALNQPERQTSPSFPSFLDCVKREHRRLSSSFFDASREDWTARSNKLRGWLESGVPRDSRLQVLASITKAWGFKQRIDFMKQPHTDAEKAAFMTHVMADILLEKEIQSLGQAPSMVGLPVSVAIKDENVFRIIGQIKSGSSPGDQELDQAIDDSEETYQEYQKRQNYLGMFTSLMRQAEFLWNKFMLFKTVTPEDAIAVISRAEKVYDDVRRKRSVPLAHHYSIAGKMQQLQSHLLEPHCLELAPCEAGRRTEEASGRRRETRARSTPQGARSDLARCLRGIRLLDSKVQGKGDTRYFESRIADPAKTARPMQPGPCRG